MTNMAETVSDEEREEILDWVEELAEGYMNQYGGCAQCGLLAIQRKLDLPGGSDVLKAASFLGLGTARMGNICGGLLGGIMAMGLASGRGNLKDPAYPEPEVIDEVSGLPKSLVLVKNFYVSFIQEFGSWICRDLQIKMFGRSFDLMIPEEKRDFSEMPEVKEKCAALVGKAARMAAETIMKMPRT
jgi:C_GCAxxG_C_C family probable redox protein